MKSVTLSDEDMEMVRLRVESGQFSSPQEVISAALEAFHQHEQLKSLRAELQIALDQQERGEGIPYSDEWSEKVKQDAQSDFLDGKPIKHFVKP